MQYNDRLMSSYPDVVDHILYLVFNTIGGLVYGYANNNAHPTQCAHRIWPIEDYEKQWGRGRGS